MLAHSATFAPHRNDDNKTVFFCSPFVSQIFFWNFFCSCFCRSSTHSRHNTANNVKFFSKERRSTALYWAESAQSICYGFISPVCRSSQIRTFTHESLCRLFLVLRRRFVLVITLDVRMDTHACAIAATNRWRALHLRAFFSFFRFEWRDFSLFWMRADATHH